MKRRLLAGALAATMALSMTACGSGGGSTDTQGSGSSDGLPTTLNLILRAGAYADVIKECLPKFEEEHNVKCEVQELSESDLYSGIALDAINQKGSYDLCMVDGSWMAEFTENGVLANLSDLGYELDDDIIPATTSICYVGDDVYLAPYYGNVTVLMLNKENVKAAGYTADTLESLDDVLAVCEKAKADGKKGCIYRGDSQNNTVVDFLPILLSFLHWIPFMDWTGPMMGNLFGIFLICYFIMWFAVPAARSARQKLEMNGEKITAQSIRETTEATAGCDPDVRAKPIVAEAVSVFGKVVLILLKLFAGLLVFGLIMGACALIIGLFALVIGGGGILSPFFPLGMTLWVPILGIFIVLIPVILLIYVLMCLIASRKPGGTTVLVIFLLWLASFIACACITIREDVGDRFRAKRNVIEQVLNTEVVIDNDTTTVQKLLKEYESQNVIEDGHKTLHISIPNKSIDITIDKDKAGLEVKADGKRVKVGKSRKASAEEAGQSTQAAAEADADTAAQEQQTE